MLLLVPVYAVVHGWANFLWFSNVALLVTFVAVWVESRRLVSMMAVGVLLPEAAWNVDFLLGLVAGWQPLELTAYMFDEDLSAMVRSLSLFHVALPVLLVWLVWRLGYDVRAWRWQVGLGWGVLLLTYLISEPTANINWVFGPGEEPQQWMPAAAWLGVMLVIYPLVIVLPTHALLRWLFGGAGAGAGRA
ncbi:hypothetical protein ACERK3_14340 [Phycisphaerales bacterium AB-hyl4]|uniref:Membrane-associated protein n=1 Tax=Natronomicrosphaera hydrolytica TaxID=3242702 RepID=A0ABV4U794_9BACT